MRPAGFAWSVYASLRFNLMSLRFCLAKRIPVCPVFVEKYRSAVYSGSARRIVVPPDVSDHTFRHELAHHFHASKHGVDFLVSPHGSYFMAAEIIVGQFFSGNKQGG